MLELVQTIIVVTLPDWRFTEAAIRLMDFIHAEIWAVVRAVSGG